MPDPSPRGRVLRELRELEAAERAAEAAELERVRCAVGTLRPEGYLEVPLPGPLGGVLVRDLLTRAERRQEAARHIRRGLEGLEVRVAVVILGGDT